MPVKYYTIPQTMEACTPSVIADLKNIGLIASNVVVWESPSEWFINNFWGPILTVPYDSDKPRKVWNIRQGTNFSETYLRFAKDENGAWKKWSVVSTNPAIPGANPPETIVFPEGPNKNAPVNMIQVLGQSAQNFFAEYATKIGFIPQLEVITPNKTFLNFLNFENTGSFEQLPFNTIWPGDYVPMFDSAGNPAIVKISDYIKNTPKPSSGVSKYTDEQIGAAIRANINFLDDKALGKYAKTLVLG